MKKVYISSTFKDLIEFRKATSEALRKIRYDVIRMEEYVARDLRTRAACEADVEGCDIYVGIFAWRYGYIPKDDNEENRSITELEYRKALGNKPCFIFLLSDDAPWPSTLRDAETDEGGRGERIRNLRAELKERCAAYFSTPEGLAMEVIAAIVQHESSRQVQRLDVIEEIKRSVGLGPSFLPNIQSKIVEAQNAEIVEIILGPTPWWTTRLHLVAALASDFTKIQQFLFLDSNGLYLLMASPIEVRRALTRHFPQLEQAYLGSRLSASQNEVPPAGAIDYIISMYQEQIFHAFSNRTEQDVKQDLTPIMLCRDLGIEPSAETVEQGGVNRSLLQWDMLRRKTPFVAMLDHGKLVSVIDRVQMASEIAIQAIKENVD